MSSTWPGNSPALFWLKRPPGKRATPHLRLGPSLKRRFYIVRRDEKKCPTNWGSGEEGRLEVGGWRCRLAMQLTGPVLGTGRWRRDPISGWHPSYTVALSLFARRTLNLISGMRYGSSEQDNRMQGYLAIRVKKQAGAGPMMATPVRLRTYKVVESLLCVPFPSFPPQPQSHAVKKRADQRRD